MWDVVPSAEWWIVYPLAILSVGGIVSLIGWLRDRGKDDDD